MPTVTLRTAVSSFSRAPRVRTRPGHRPGYGGRMVERSEPTFRRMRRRITATKRGHISSNREKKLQFQVPSARSSHGKKKKTSERVRRAGQAQCAARSKEPGVCNCDVNPIAGGADVPLRKAEHRFHYGTQGYRAAPERVRCQGSCGIRLPFCMPYFMTFAMFSCFTAL